MAEILTKSEIRKIRKAGLAHKHQQILFGWHNPEGSGSKRTRKRALERARQAARNLA